jgi:glycosyltransferase involved in cell wall biosynthesis
VGNSGGGQLFELGASEEVNAERLADALESLLADPEKARALGESGRTAVQREYTMTRLAERLVGITREMIDSPQSVH